MTRLPMRLVTHRRFVRVVAGVVGLLTLVFLLGWWASHQRPGWWRSIDVSLPEIRERAQSVENGLTTLLSQARALRSGQGESEPWTMTLDDASASAWLAARLPAWVEHQFGAKAWPGKIEQVQTRFFPGGVTVTASVEVSEVRRFVSASFTPRIDVEGRLWLSGTSARIGQLPVPLSIVNGSLKLKASNAAGELWNALREEGPLGAARFKLADGREVVIREISCSEGAMKLTCVTRSAR